MEKNILVKVKNKVSFVYIEKAKITVKDFSVVAMREDSVVDIPIATINTLILGVGTSITQNAVIEISKFGCTVVWSGSSLNYFYTFGQPQTFSSKNLLLQCKLHESKVASLEVVRNMYSLRYPSEHLKSKSKEDLLGLEGMKMQECYKKLANESGVVWVERTYHVEDFYSQDYINKCITTANQLLYAVITAIVVSLGFSTALSFVHNGKMMSFVYDLADLYKESLVLPLVFEYCSKTIDTEDSLRELKKVLNYQFLTLKFLQRVVNDIKFIFTNNINLNDIDFSEFNEVDFVEI